ncbi:RraA family protein [Treponema primitia]|uniref:RraA family protein n=1 Tax=Treponema primitia TaxID=88058 RepID=UPI00397FA853
MEAKKLIEGFLKLPTGNVCDANGKSGNMDYHIKPIDPKSKLAGPAFTVPCMPGDNIAIHEAIYAAPAGSVLVIDMKGYTRAGPIGEIVVTACMMQNLAGIVIDGTVRDGADIEALGFPLFCRGLNPGGTLKNVLTDLNTPIVCGGVQVNPGDMIVGDRDGVVVIAKEKAQEVLGKAQAISDKEDIITREIKGGKTTLEIYGFDKKIKEIRGI